MLNASEFKSSNTYGIRLLFYNFCLHPAPSQPPSKVMWNTSNSKIILNWEQVKPLENESEVMGYKVSQIFLQNWKTMFICCSSCLTAIFSLEYIRKVTAPCCSLSKHFQYFSATKCSDMCMTASQIICRFAYVAFFSGISLLKILMWKDL